MKKRLKKPKGQLHSNRKLERWISEALSLSFSFFNYDCSLKASVIIRLCLSFQMIMLFTELTVSIFSILMGLFKVLF